MIKWETAQTSMELTIVLAIKDIQGMDLLAQVCLALESIFNDLRS